MFGDSLGSGIGPPHRAGIMSIVISSTGNHSRHVGRNTQRRPPKARCAITLMTTVSPLRSSHHQPGFCGAALDHTTVAEPFDAANPAFTFWLQSLFMVGRIADLGR